jgi:regulator of protease activity HflC (stomatin/prohibitin superfamily)
LHASKRLTIDHARQLDIEELLSDRIRSMQPLQADEPTGINPTRPGVLITHVNIRSHEGHHVLAIRPK